MRSLYHLLAVTVLLTPFMGRFVEATEPDPSQLAALRTMGEHLAERLVQLCPTAPANSRTDFDACRKRIFDVRDELQQNFAPFVYWGGTRPNVAFEEAPTTQFNAFTWVTLYLPLFTFTGPSAVEYDAAENKYLLRMAVGFRSQLEPGQYPYPFWHSGAKWSAYLDANQLIFYFDPEKNVITGIARSKDAPSWPNTTVSTAPPAPFVADRWLWVDEKGQLQPEVTLFSGLYRADNPYLKQMDAQYRKLAIELRQGSCFVCHTPENPDRMRHLALFQTPAHAAGEIDRIIKDLETGRMPRESVIWSVGKLDPAQQQQFLSEARAFKHLVEQAASWETQQAVIIKKP